LEHGKKLDQFISKTIKCFEKRTGTGKKKSVFSDSNKFYIYVTKKITDYLIKTAPDKLTRIIRSSPAITAILNSTNKNRLNYNEDDHAIQIDTTEFPKDIYITLLKDFSPAIGKTIDILLMEISEKRISEDCSIIITMEKFKNLRGISDHKVATKQIKEAFNTIKSIKFSCNEKRDGKEVSFTNISMYGGTDSIGNGKIFFRFNSDFINYFVGCSKGTYPLELLKINDHRNPNSYFLGRYIYDHCQNVNKGKRHILSVRILLNLCSNIPTPEEVSKTDRHFSKRIIEPFERDLDALGVIFKWEYCHSDETPLLDNELNDMNCNMLIKLYVKITWISNYNALQYDDNRKLIAAKLL
jgi:hypothetical protein